MRIGLITGEYPPMEGGVADYTRILGRELAAAGNQVYVLTHPGGTGLNDPAVQVTPIITNWNRAFFKTIPGWVRQHQLDVVNLQYQTAAYRMAGAIHLLPARIRSAPYITTFHDLRYPYLFPKAGALRPYLVRLMARLSDGAIVTDHGDEAALGRDPQVRNLVQIPIGSNLRVQPASPQGRETVRRRMGVDEGTLVIGHFGFINASKGIDTLLKAAHLVGKRRIALRVMMIGGRTGSSDPTNQASVAQIDELARKLRLDVYWTGFVAEDEIAAIFAATDIMVLPFRDGASLRRGSLMAALAYGKPIITTEPADPMPELLNGRDILYVPVDDEHALARQIIALAGDPDQRTRLGVQAGLSAKQFEWEAIAHRTLEFYELVRASIG